MPVAVTPPDCPDCGRPFELTYSRVRGAVMAPAARAGLAAGVAGTVILIPVLVWAATGEASAAARDWGLLRREGGLVVLAACAAAVVVGFLPAVVGWRFAFSRPRLFRADCPQCKWAGTVRVRGLDVAATPPVGGGPNPDFDFK